jgi:hypothetical protein
MMAKGGVHINGRQVKEDTRVDENSLLEDRIMIVRFGKMIRIIEVIPKQEVILRDGVEAAESL